MKYLFILGFLFRLFHWFYLFSLILELLSLLEHKHVQSLQFGLELNLTLPSFFYGYEILFRRLYSTSGFNLKVCLLFGFLFSWG